jgi:hypothetical protein
MNLTLREFSGMAPLIQPRNLADSMATSAINTRFDRSGIVPWNSPGLIGSGTSGGVIRSLYRYNNSWLTSVNYRQYAKHPAPNDVHERIYYTDSGYPKMRSGSQEYRIGLPRPSAPAVTVTTPGDLSALVNVRNQRYVISFVDAFGVEGPSSLPSPSAEVGPGFSVSLDISGAVASGSYNMGAGALIRMYRLNNSSDGDAVFQYLGDVAYGTLTFVDTIVPSALEEALQSSTWVAPPDTLASLVECPGEFLAGHSGRTVYFSEPGIPSAWPYSYTIAEDIVGLVYIQGGLFVCTTGKPVLFTGSHPSVMAEIPIESAEACVSATSIVDMGEYALYASPRGIVAAQGNTAKLITTEILDKDQWQNYFPEEIIAFNYRGKYVAFYGDSAGEGFIFDPEGGANSFIQLGILPPSAGYLDTDTGELALVVHLSPTSYNIVEFDTAAPLSAVWVSKVFDVNDAVGFTCLRLQADTYPVHLQIFADGISVGTFAVPDGKPHRLPSGYRARLWQFAITTTTPFQLLSLAESLGELE